MSDGPDDGDTPGGDFLRRLPAEVQRWRGEGLIGARHARQILAYYGLSYSALATGRRLGRAVSIFSVLGAVLVGVGVILLVSANREEVAEMPRGLKVALLFAGVVGTLAAGYHLRFETRWTRIGEAVLLLSAILYGAAVFLVGQIYHVRSNDPSLMAYWLAGVAPLAYLSRSTPLFGMSVLVASAWIGLRLAFAMKDTHPDDQAALRTIPVFLSYGVLLYFLAPLHDRLAAVRPYARLLGPLGIAFALAALYALTFREAYDLREQGLEDLPALPAGVLMTYVTLSAASLVALAVSWRLDPDGWRSRPYEAAPVLLLAIVYLPLYLPSENANAYALLFNVLLLVSAFGTMALGLQRRDGTVVNLGIAFFALLVFTRYVDLAWGLFGGALFFMGAGALALAGSVLLEVYRRRVLRRLREV